jgi:hypothetical protein
MFMRCEGKKNLQEEKRAKFHAREAESTRISMRDVIKGSAQRDAEYILSKALFFLAKKSLTRNEKDVGKYNSMNVTMF